MRKFEVRVAHSHIFTIEAGDSEEAVRRVFSGEVLRAVRTYEEEVKFTSVFTQELFSPILKTQSTG